MADEKLNPGQEEQIRLAISGESPAPDLTPPRRRVSRRPAWEREPSALPSSGRRKLSPSHLERQKSIRYNGKKRRKIRWETKKA